MLKVVRGRCSQLPQVAVQTSRPNTWKTELLFLLPKQMEKIGQRFSIFCGQNQHLESVLRMLIPKHDAQRFQFINLWEASEISCTSWMDSRESDALGSTPAMRPGQLHRALSSKGCWTWFYTIIAVLKCLVTLNKRPLIFLLHRVLQIMWLVLCP